MTEVGYCNATYKRLSLHAGVYVEGDARDGLVKFFRYMSRSAVSPTRLSYANSEEPETSPIRLALKRPWSDGSTSLEFSQVDFVERLAAIIPEPWTNLTRYHGVFAPGHGWRDFIVPGRRLLPRPLDMNCDMGASSDDGDDAPINKNSSSGRAHAEYWLPWAKLLRKTFGVCPERCTCGAKMSVRDVTTDREDFIFFLPFHITGIGDMMTRMGLASTAPPLGRIAEAPGELQYLFED